MNNYKFKDIPLSNILEGGNAANPLFIGMNYAVANTNNSKALPFGYSSNLPARAKYTEITSLGINPITVPSGAKYIRFIGIGGAGGTGGAGGNAFDSDVPRKPTDKRVGLGSTVGGAGGAGGRSYLNQTAISPSSVIVVNIGARGNTGARGNDDDSEDPTNYVTQGNAGAVGNTGGETFINIGQTKYAQANGGIGGNGANGGYVYDGPGLSNNFGNGNAGNTGANGTGNESNNGVWDVSGDYGTVNATGGYASIIWLYD